MTMIIDMAIIEGDNCSLTITGMSPMDFDRMRMLIIDEWSAEDPTIGEKLAISTDNHVKTPFDIFLSSLTWGPWIDWDGMSDWPEEGFIDGEEEVLVHVGRRGPDPMHWITAERHNIDWHHSGGQEDVLRYRINIRVDSVTESV